MAFFNKILLKLFVMFVAIGIAHAKTLKNKRAVLVFDAASGRILKQEHANELRHPASLTKKMALRIVFKALKQGKINFNTIFTVSKYASLQPPCSMGLKPGERVAVIDLIKGSITKSGNDSMCTLAEGIAGSISAFVRMMNAEAQELGMSKTIFYNPTGLPNPHQFTTAKDMLILAQSLLRDFPEYYGLFKTVNFSYKDRNFRNHNQMLGIVPGMEGIKTGFVNASGFCISTSTVRDGRRVYVIVMGGNTWRERDKEVVSLLETAFQNLPQAESLAPNVPHHDERDTESAQATEPNNVSLVNYLEGVDAKAELQKTLQEPLIKKENNKSPKIVSLSSVKRLDEGRIIKAVWSKPLLKKKKSSKRKRA